jgi:hypothetical protein
LEHYPEERDEAIVYQDFALDEFREMKLQPSLKKAMALKKSFWTYKYSSLGLNIFSVFDW